MAQEQERLLGEKVIWWTKVGGVIAGVLGLLRHYAELAVGGAATAAAAIGLEGILYKRKQQSSA